MFKLFFLSTHIAFLLVVMFVCCRLLDVVHCDRKLHLVFEYLNLDLKKYIDSSPVTGLPLSLVKVNY